MQQHPLMISSIIEFAERWHPDVEIVSRTTEGPIHRYTYKDLGKRARKLATGLAQIGVAEGDRVGTLAWNGYRHMELYYGVSGSGAVLHTVNPRLFAEQMAYVINHAGDKVIFSHKAPGPTNIPASIFQRRRQRTPMKESGCRILWRVQSILFRAS